MKHIILCVSVLVMFILCSVGAFAGKEPAMWWKFEQEKGRTTTERTGKIEDKIVGNFKFAGGETCFFVNRTYWVIAF